MKKEIIKQDKETSLMKREIYAVESETASLKELSEKLSIMIHEDDRDRRNLKSSIIFIKKHIDKLKQNIKHEDAKSKEFIHEISTLVDRTSRADNY